MDFYFFEDFKKNINVIRNTVNGQNDFLFNITRKYNNMETEAIHHTFNTIDTILEWGRIKCYGDDRFRQHDFLKKFADDLEIFVSLIEERELDKKVAKNLGIA